VTTQVRKKSEELRVRPIQLTRWCHLRSVPVNLPAPFEDTLIPLLLQHCLILLICCTYSDYSECSLHLSVLSLLLLKLDQIFNVLMYNAFHNYLPSSRPGHCGHYRCTTQ